MEKFTEIFNNLITQSLNQAYAFAMEHGPGIAFALSLILFGWVCAVLIRKITTKILRALGFDVLAHKTGLKKFLEKGGIERNPSSIAGWILYWIIFLNALIMAQDAVDLNVTAQFIQNVILYMPNIIVVIIILALGIFIGKFIATFVDKTAHLANIPIHNLLGNIARYAVIGFALIVILDYVNVSAIMMSHMIMVIFAIVPVGFFLLFLVGGRDVIANILTGRFLAQELKKGDHIECGSASGEVLFIGAIASKLRTKDGEAIVPNSELAKNIIKKK